MANANAGAKPGRPRDSDDAITEPEVEMPATGQQARPTAIIQLCRTSPLRLDVPLVYRLVQTSRAPPIGEVRCVRVRH